jgi:hypothetical protein
VNDKRLTAGYENLTAEGLDKLKKGIIFVSVKRLLANVLYL